MTTLRIEPNNTFVKEDIYDILRELNIQIDKDTLIELYTNSLDKEQKIKDYKLFGEHHPNNL